MPYPCLYFFLSKATYDNILAIPVELVSILPLVGVQSWSQKVHHLGKIFQVAEVFTVPSLNKLKRQDYF